MQMPEVLFPVLPRRLSRFRAEALSEAADRGEAHASGNPVRRTSDLSGMQKTAETVFACGGKPSCPRLKKGAHRMVYTAEYASPLGMITLACDDEAITGLWFNGQKHFGSILPQETLR